jgi:hypothetical protein
MQTGCNKKKVIAISTPALPLGFSVFKIVNK